MAYLVREVEDIELISGRDFIAELEFIKFIEPKSGKSRKFLVKGLCPISFEDCQRVDKTVEWIKANFHFVVDVDETAEMK